MFGIDDTSPMHEKSGTFIALGLAQHGIGSFNVIAAGV